MLPDRKLGSCFLTLAALWGTGCQSTGHLSATAKPAPHFRKSEVVNQASKHPPSIVLEDTAARRAAPDVTIPGDASLPDEIALTSAEEPVPSDKPVARDEPERIEAIGLDEAGEILTLASLERFALEHNPAIKQAAAAVSKAMGFRDQVGRYPNPVAGYNATQLADRGTDQHTGFVEQDIVLGKKLDRNRLVLEQEVQAQLWQVEMTRLRVLTDVRVRFYETLAAQQRLRLANDFQTVAAKGVDAAQRRLDALEGSRPELLQARIQRSEVQLLRERAEIGFRAAWNGLFAMVGLPCRADGGLAGSLSLPVETRDWESVYCQLLEVSPELRMAGSRVARAQANLDRQKAQPIPNLSLMVAGGYDNGTGSEMINTQVGMPIPIYNKNQGNIVAAHAEYCRATQEMQRLKLSLRVRLVNAAREYDSAAAQVRRYRDEIVPNAQEALELSEQAYRAGEFEFLQVLIVRRTFFDSNLQLVEAESDFAQANSLIDGLLLSGGLTESTDTDADDGLRGQTLSGQ